MTSSSVRASFYYQVLLLFPELLSGEKEYGAICFEADSVLERVPDLNSKCN